MKLTDFDYPFNTNFIAQTPTTPRDHSRLMVVSPQNTCPQDCHFYDLLELLGENDVLVVNKTQAIRARMRGYVVLQDGKRREVEVVLLHEQALGYWECAVFPGERLKVGKEVYFLDRNGKDTLLKASVKEITYAGRLLQFNYCGVDFWKMLDDIGHIPLPPYIHIPFSDILRYNTVYAQNPGSAAAPTAGLHFTPELIAKLKDKGVIFEEVLLHIGLGTFKPITSENIEDHEIHKEYIHLPEETATRLNDYKKTGKRIIAVGTTAVRALESFAQEDGFLSWGEKETNIFIYPGYNFRFTQSIITNFHLPKSSLVMMISAFAGRENLLDWYAYAQKNGYRFFSFGDAMWIQNKK